MTNWTGSIINRIIESGTPAEPEVGMGATLMLYSDRHAYTVRRVEKSKSGKTVTIYVSRDKATRTDDHGMSESQTYEYETVEDAPQAKFVSRSGKPFRQYASGPILAVGGRDEYYDFSF